MRTKKFIAILGLILLSYSVSIAQELNNSIYFKAGKITVDKSSYEELYDIADIMQALPDYDFLIAGHVDSASSIESGIEISKKRADAVRNFLIEIGVNPNQMETMGYGTTKPKYNNNKSTGRKRNRRVEISLLGSEEAIDDDVIADEDNIDDDFNLIEIAKEYNIPIQVLREWNEIVGKLAFLEGKNDQLNKNIHFRSGSMLIRKSSKGLLNKIAEFMIRYPSAKFTLGGHTDSLGSIAYNEEVSLGRANAVKDFFVKRGVPSKNLTVIGYGYDKPKFVNQKTWGKTQLNRRVEVRFDALEKYNIKKAQKIETAQIEAAENEKNKYNYTDIKNRVAKFHKVKRHETLYSISQMYDVKIKDIRFWNKIVGNTIYTRQKILVYVKK
jgi:outer membrane protein OmpA-like peptidoglycan-associated protein